MTRRDVGTRSPGMAYRLCPDYRPGRAIDLDVACGSGETDGVAFRHECRKCIVGQFSTSGEFFGDLVSSSEAGQAVEFVGVASGGKEAQA